MNDNFKDGDAITLQLPARNPDVVTQELGHELMVYDLKKHKGHSLNKTAAVAWGLCDGRTTIPEIAGALSAELQQPFDEELVWLTLRQLEKADLLVEPVTPAGKSVSRREVMRKFAYAAFLLPIVSSVVAPSAAAAASCKANGTTVTCPAGTNASCCSGNCFVTTTVCCAIKTQACLVDTDCCAFLAGTSGASCVGNTSCNK